MSILMVDSNQALNVIQKKGVEAVYNTILQHHSYYRVWLYIRLSEADSDEGYESESESIINQRNLLINYVKQNEFTFVDEYSDDGFTGTNFDMYRCRSVLKDFFTANQCEVSVEFEDTRNILDRILNEFSPWKKRCECIRKKDKNNSVPAKYKLTIYYHGYDQMDMVIRLMSYGPYIRFIDKKHFICQEIMKRIGKQQELLRNREKEK